MNTPVWDYSDLLEEKLIMEGEIKNDQNNNLQ